MTLLLIGTDALARLEAFKFDIVLCDLDLGRGPNGFDVLKRMPLANRDTPLVILTAHGTKAREHEAIRLGATDFLEKPLRRDHLLSTLEYAIADAGEVRTLAPADIAADVRLELPYDELGAAHVRRAIQIMERRYPECDLTVEAIATEGGISPEHLARRFDERIGHGPLVHLHEIRISQAEPLLADRSLSIYTIGFNCGYARTSKFSSWFRRLRGSTPIRFRRRGD